MNFKYGDEVIIDNDYPRIKAYGTVIGFAPCISNDLNEIRTYIVVELRESDRGYLTLEGNHIEERERQRGFISRVVVHPDNITLKV